MRYPAEQKAETHEKILAAAARSLREHASEIHGIGQVMKELALTKGGFYRHFESKGDLYASAVARAFEELGDRLVAVVKGAPTGAGLRVIIGNHLSAKHLSAPRAGCLLAALGPEIARQPLAIRKRINQSMLAYRERMLPWIRAVTSTRSALPPSFCSQEWPAHSLPPERLQTRKVGTGCWPPRGHSIWRRSPSKRWSKKFGE